MSVETLKELDDFLRSMRQAYNSRDVKTFRTHFWTDKRFVHIDAAGRIDVGWGAFEEILDQEFRYLDTARLELRDVETEAFDDRFAAVAARYKIEQIDPDGRTIEQLGRVTYSIVRMRDDWKIVQAHYSVDPEAVY
jgi:hypothetical protein